MMDSLQDRFGSLSIAGRLQRCEAVYILDVAVASCGADALAVCCSNYSVCLHDPETLLMLGEFKGHSAPVCGVRVSHVSPHLLFTGSADGTLRCWDARKPGSDSTQVFRSDPTHAYCSYDLSCNDRVLCAGTEQVEEDSFLVFWDVRMVHQGEDKESKDGRLLGVYSESHSDDITAVKFHPQQPDRLASGATDGLVNVFDLSLGGEEDALVTTCNSNSSASSLCWAGGDFEQLLCLTHDEGLYLWDVAHLDSEDPMTLLSAVDARTLVQESDNTTLEYFIGGTWLSDQERLLLVGGSNSGDVHLLDCSVSGLKPIKSLIGHSATVRCFQWDVIGRALLTGGEDGQLIRWKATVGKKDSLKSISSMQLKSKSHRKQMNKKRV